MLAYIQLYTCTLIETIHIIHTYIHTVAMQQAGTAAGNIAKYLKSSNSSDGLSIFKYLPLGEMLTLGQGDGSINRRSLSDGGRNSICICTCMFKSM